MRLRTTFACLLIGVLAAPLAFAMPGGGGDTKPDTPPPSSPGLPPSASASQLTGARQDAERAYAIAYEEIGKAKKDLDNGKTKNAEKKFKRALERVQDAVALDANYYQAWNLVGYAARKLGDYDRAFAAYEKCLSIQPDYAPAREYLGEAWLEKGDSAKAREQLTLLEKLNADSEETKTLRSAVDAYAAAHPEAPKASPEPAPSDSSTAKTEVK